MYKIITFIPESHLEQVKAAMFAAGAGHIGNYDCCCFTSKGFGQFRPLPGSDPFIGQQGKIETVEEYKVEMVCPKELLKHVIQAMIEAHPYEEVAYDVFENVEPGS